MKGTRKEVNELIGMISKIPGWRVEIRTKHFMVYPPKPSKMICVSKSPGHTSAIKKIKADIKRSHDLGAYFR